MADSDKISATIKSLERNFAREARERNVRSWKKLDNRSHPLSLVYTATIRDLGKLGRKTNTATEGASSTDTDGDHKQSDPLTSDPLSDPLRGGDPLSDPLRDPLSDPLSSTLSDPLSSTGMVPSTHGAQKHKSAVNTSTTNTATSSPTRKRAATKSMGIMAEERARRWAKEREGLPSDFETWRDKRGGILKTYTSNKRIGVTANFLDEKEQEAAAGGGSTENEELKKKMEQLDMDAKEDKLFLSQTEYIKRMVCTLQRGHSLKYHLWTEGGNEGVCGWMGYSVSM